MKFAGRYKGNRRRREPSIVASCICGWRSRPCTPKRAERRHQAHIVVRHAGQNRAVDSDTSKTLLLPAPANTSLGT